MRISTDLLLVLVLLVLLLVLEVLLLLRTTTTKWRWCYHQVAAYHHRLFIISTGLLLAIDSTAVIDSTDWTAVSD